MLEKSNRYSHKRYSDQCVLDVNSHHTRTFHRHSYRDEDWGMVRSLFLRSDWSYTHFRGITATTQPDQIEFFIPSWTNVSVYSFAIFLAAASTFTSIMLTSARPEMELKSTREQMKLLANTDSLTGLYNRRYFTESAQRDFIRARRFNHSASVLFADLDHFKDINDTYGHSVGDAILNATERIRKAIEEENFELDGHQINYTIIIGVAALCPDDKSIQDLIDRADAALYRSRKNGRNQVQMG